MSSRSLRCVLAVTAALMLLAATAQPGGASAAYGSSGVFFAGGGQCAKWAHSWTSWTQVTTGQPTVAMTNLGGYTLAASGAPCGTPLALPEGWIYATGRLYQLWDGSWRVWMVKNATNVGGSSVASFSQDASVHPTWYYTRGTWTTVQVGATHVLTTGAEYPVQWLAP